ncbi:RDD family protein [Yinghuangia soli]|uniref:RDD family protein n=1 Tax=Yinghuangia soli TaxID=2908204 RepID=A0AA41U5V7_9ACTN|nr:RDD family protein [Yinghuangia soli]MCF2532307.1 RDD family protein [Yinghuangia soli]
MSTSEPPGPPDPFRKEPSGSDADPAQPQPPYGQPPQGGQPPYGQDPYGGAVPPPGQPYGQMPPPPGEYGAPYNAGPTLGGSGRRFMARVIDTLIWFVIAFVISLAFVGTDTDDVSLGKQIGIGAVAAVLYFLYEGLMLNNNGQTLGKKAAGIRVVRVADGGSVQGSPSWIRAAVYVLPLILSCPGLVFWLINVLWHTWDQPWQQCLHDKAAKTTVIRV